MSNERLLKVILSPHISEKASLATEKNGEYVFKVLKDANKIEIKAAIEFLFDTKVNAVTVSNVKSKPKRFGQIEGKSKTWKKAYVQLVKGREINFGGENQ